ncbi:hypothetical protein LWI28_020904 [Acer negundo]|uniref:TF-B3 domain-containing protein n=1 Tax=Acer negundo TaxID=4023 RepID=A0AAD5J4A7_ACENE|nr:hypothetical protein LWI28_006068 [Acer negundo]KAI9186790.1 hypothetical protein LWI28_020904 [Acer negundo]KAK4840964.1 hypothetical protein QYF36_022498 [Acer negundo]
MALPPFTVSKILTNYDITERVGLPTKILQHIPIPQGIHYVDLHVTDSSDQVTFQLYTRPRGNRANPVFTRGWLEFARAKRLQAGDKLIIYRGQDGELQIQIQRTSYVTFLERPVYLDVENFP